MAILHFQEFSCILKLMVLETQEKNNTFIGELFKAGGHIGYTKSRRHPKTRDFIFGVRNNIEIIDLAESEKHVVLAEEFLHKLGLEGKIVLVVGTKPNTQGLAKEMAIFLNLPYVNQRWLGGTITNFKVLGGRITFLRTLEEEEKSGGFEKYAKKERSVRKIKLEKLRNMFDGLRNLKSTPDALLIIDPIKEKTALTEAISKNIPVIALMNVDSNPDEIKFPIPVNHNSQKAIVLVLERLKKAYEAGAKEKENISTNNPPVL